MTEIREYICDMCGAVQRLDFSPKTLYSNYWRITRGEGLGITEDTPEALCLECGPKVFDYIKAEHTKLKQQNLKPGDQRKENRVSTRRETGYQ